MGAGWPWIALTVVAMCITAALIGLRVRRCAIESAAPWPFYAKKPLSLPEQVLYFRLTKALPGHIVLAQVALSRLLGVKKGNTHRGWNNRINRMSVDFVVCNRDSGIVAVIELDDATHARGQRKTADAKKDKALGAAGIRVVRCEVKTLPDETAIKSLVLENNAS